MKNNKDRYVPYVDNFESHIHDIAHHDGRTSSYGTEAEIYATCQIFDIDIFVYKADNKNHEWQRFSTTEDCCHQKMYICLDNAALHFNFLLRSERPCCCSTKKNQPAPSYSSVTKMNICSALQRTE